MRHGKQLELLYQKCNLYNVNSLILEAKMSDNLLSTSQSTRSSRSLQSNDCMIKIILQNGPFGQVPSSFVQMHWGSSSLEDFTSQT